MVQTKAKVIKESIKINAPKEKVWQILTDDKYTRIWYSEFSEGSHAQTDWKLGSKAIFADNSGNGLVAKIIENKPNEIISMEYQGMFIDGKEDTQSEHAKEVIGGSETYTLSESEGITTLTTQLDMSCDMFDSMTEAWKKALNKIKDLSESI